MLVRLEHLLWRRFERMLQAIPGGSPKKSPTSYSDGTPHVPLSSLERLDQPSSMIQVSHKVDDAW